MKLSTQALRGAFFVACALAGVGQAEAVSTTLVQPTSSAWTDLGAGPLQLQTGVNACYFSVSDTAPNFSDPGFSISLQYEFAGPIPFQTTSHVYAKAKEGPCYVVVSPITGYGSGGGSTGGTSGGTANAATTSNATDGQATSTTNQQNVVYNYGFNGTTWDRVRESGGSTYVLLQNALPAGTNTIGAVTQSGSWSVGVSSLPALAAGSATIGSIANTAFGVSAGTAQVGSLVDGVVPSGWSPLPSVSSATTLGTVIDTAGFNSVDVEIVISGVATVIYEGNDDASLSYFNVIGVVTSSGGTFSDGSSTASSTTVCLPAVTRFLRVRVANYTSGTITGAAQLRTGTCPTRSTYAYQGTASTSPWLTALVPVTTLSRLQSSAASTNATLVKASSTRITKVYGCNTTTSPITIHLTNSATAPTPGTTAVARSRIFPASSAAGTPACSSFDDNDFGFTLGSGSGYWISSGNSDTDATALTAGAIINLEVSYQ